MDFQTDLAMERSEILEKNNTNIIDKEEYISGSVKMTKFEITDEIISKTLEKPIGKYITAELPPFAEDTEMFDGRLDILSNELRSLLPKEGLILIAGLGNDLITPDALGPKCIEYVLATRHISESLARELGFSSLRPVAGIVPGVLGKTGIETGEIISGIAKCVRPSAVITVDALCSTNLHRLGKTVQFTDTGIVPGSGVGNARVGINRELLGVDVVSIGVPTVVNGKTLAEDIMKVDAQKKNNGFSEDMIVTPKEIDRLIEHAAKLVAMVINHALQPDIDCEDILSLVT